MLIFWFITIIYGLANLYIFFKLSHLLNLVFPLNIFLGLLILFLALSPVLIHLYSFRGSEKSVRVFTYTGYMWLAFLTPFFPTAIILDLYNIAIQYSNIFFNKDLSSVALSPALAFIIPFFLSITINTYGYFEAKNLCVERLTIKTSKLPKGINKLTIAQISDLHLGIIVRDKTLDKVIKKIEDIKPDLIVSTGDLVDGVIKYIDHLTDRLKKVQARFGKFAVIGNHEFYGGLKHTVKFLEDSGFTVLGGRGVTVKNMINIAGASYIAEEKKNRDKNSKSVSEREILTKLPSDIFTLLLKHRSDVEDESPGLFDLQLSGHTHKGQIFPMSLATMFIFKHHSGFTELPNGSAIYVSRGAGTAGPPVRFLSRPEITVIEIVSANTTISGLISKTIKSKT